MRTTYIPHLDVVKDLYLGLKFVPYLQHQYHTKSSTLAAYTKNAKSKLEDITQQRLALFMDFNTAWNSQEQVTMCHMLQYLN